MPDSDCRLVIPRIMRLNRYKVRLNSLKHSGRVGLPPAAAVVKFSQQVTVESLWATSVAGAGATGEKVKGSEHRHG